MNIRQPEKPSPADESCTVSQQIYGAMLEPSQDPSQEGRLGDTLRKAAQIRKPGGGGDAVAILTLAANELCRTHLHDSPPNPSLAMALADLAVTGWVAFQDFCSAPPQDKPIQAVVQGAYPGADPNLVPDCVREVLDRAYSVAWFLRGQSARGDLGWIAVSGEDDLPHRPVNVPGTKYPQFNLIFTTPGATGNPVVVSSRFTIATATRPVDPPVLPPHRTLPRFLEPILPPNDQIILYIHGSDSRLEEAEALIPHLVRTPDGLPTGYSVISMDLPGSGYVNTIDHTDVGAWTPVGFLPPDPFAIPPAGNPVNDVLIPLVRKQLVLLPFLEQFIVNFVSALSSGLAQPGLVEGRIAAVMGGSLGGNLALRLAQRPEPWLRNLVAYSPGSVWDARGNFGIQLGLSDSIVVNLIGRITQDETLQSRADFFAHAFDQKILIHTQPDQWYRDGWPCKPGYITNARLDRRETYTKESRRWHWRISFEELIWTWQDPTLVKNFKQRLLLGAGVMDNNDPINICSNTQGLAKEMREAVDGDTFFFENTGHSIHAERPAALAAKVFDFLPELLIVLPDRPTVMAGGPSLPFTVKYRSGNPVGAPVWSSSNQAAGGIDKSTGIFTPAAYVRTPTRVVISATSGALSGSTFVTVMPVPTGIGISGTVTGTDFSGKDVLMKGVTVNVGPISTTTDRNGIYTLSNAPSGSVKVTASKKGYVTQSQTVVANGTITVDFDMVPTDKH